MKNRDYLREYHAEYKAEHPFKKVAYQRAAILRRSVRHGALPSAQSIKRYAITQEELIAVVKSITSDPEHRPSDPPNQ
eukprot:1998967-Prymnesium_polylepis.1